jgi:hypothetical protein
VLCVVVMAGFPWVPFFLCTFSLPCPDKLFNLDSLHLSKCSVHDEIKKYELDRHVARIREARCLHSILVCRSDENGGEGEGQNMKACTGLNWLRIGSCDEFSLII